MRPLRRGERVEASFKVAVWMRPRLEGLVRHRLYSTWAMAYHMETAARMLLAPRLERGEDAVGAMVSVRHLGPAAIGQTVRVVCRATRVVGRRVHARLEAFVKNRRIGEGRHLQVVVLAGRLRELERGRR